MANFDALKAAIDAAIYSNGSQRITGDILNGVLNSMVDAVNEKKQDPLVSGTNIKTINGTPILGSGNIVIEGGGGSDITVDSTLSTTSTNPVQNRVITNALNELEPYVLGFTIEELINSSSSSLTIDEISELVQAVENNRPIHIKSNSVSNGFCVVNSTIDDTDLLILDFTYSESHYLIEVDGISGSGDFSMTTIGGGSIDIDSELSNVSENPVQNKVITSALDGLEPYVLDFSITDLDGYILSSGGAFTITDISGLVQAVTSGKPLHIKYDDYYVGYYLVNGYIDGADVLSLEFDYNGNRYGVEADTVGGGADAFITEIGSSSISIDSELSDTSENPVQNKVISTALNEKQATLVSGTNIKTINGTSILGSGNIVIEGGGGSDITVDFELSTTSTNPVQNKVVKAAIDDLNNRLINAQDQLDALEVIISSDDVTLALAINTNQQNDTSVDGVKATITYGDTSVQAGNENVSLPTFTEVRISFPEVEDYRKPDDIVFETEDKGTLVMKTATYETEVVKVNLSAIDGADVIGQIVTINGEEFTWEGETVEKKVAFGTTYTVSANSKTGYISPSETFEASLVLREVALLYSSLETLVSYITITQSTSDPATRVGGDVNGEAIKAIRDNSHRYLGKYTAEGTVTLCQLDDSDSTKYADGTTADLTGAEGDVFMKLPHFWYRAVKTSTDIWQIGFAYGDDVPYSDPEGWKEWDGNDIIGAYEAYLSDTKLYSVSGVASTGNVTQTSFKIYASNKGSGFSLVKWKWQNIMAFLFYAMYGTTDCQGAIGYGTQSYSKETGQCDSLGMEDTVAGGNGDSGSINYWGLENWWGNKGEWVGNVKVYGTEFIITEDDGTTRTIISSSSSNYASKFVIGEHLDVIATSVGGTQSTYYCDYWNKASSSYTARIARRSGDYMKPTGGVAYCDNGGQDSTYDYHYGTRLAFRGTLIEETNVETFKALTII